MTRSVSKSTLAKRIFSWLLPIIASFVMKRIMKRLGASTTTQKPGRKHVKNKAD